MWFALFAGLASASSQLVVSVDGGIEISVDGRWSDLSDGRFTFPVTPGRHVVVARKARGEVFRGVVDVGWQETVRCRWDDGAFTCRDGAVATPVTAPVRPAPPVAWRPPVPSQVKLVFRSTDGEWADVLVDGLVVAELRNQPEAVVWTTPGQHTVEVREFLGRGSYAAQRIDTGYADTFTFGIREHQPLICYDHPTFQGWDRPMASAAVGQVQLVVRSSDGEWADVYVDGARALELRNQRDGVIWVTPGAHTVEVKDFLGDRPYATARVETAGKSLITLGIAEGSPIVSYDHWGVQSLCTGWC
jgi:hypothetical protein